MDDSEFGEWVQLDSWVSEHAPDPWIRERAVELECESNLPLKGMVHHRVASE